MRTTWRSAAAGLLAVTLLSAGAVQAQSYPASDIRFISPFAAGGSVYSITEQYTRQLEKALGANVNIQITPGGSGTIGVSAIVRAKPDGYTIGFAPSEVLSYQPLVNKDLPYRTADDYLPIVKLADRPSILYVRSDAPWQTFDEFLEHVRKNPGKVRVAVPGLNTLSDLLVRQFNKLADVRLVTVPFSGGGSGTVVQLLGGRVEASMGSVAAEIGQVRAGKIRPIAAFQKGKNQILPEATSINDAGYDVTLRVGFYVIAPKDIPAPIRERLIEVSQQIVRSEEFLEFSRKNDFVSDPKGPDEIRKELERFGTEFADLIKFIDQK